jgi:hypothetical protein
MSAVAFCRGAGGGPDRLKLCFIRRYLRLFGSFGDLPIEHLEGCLGFFARPSCCFFRLFESFTRLLEFCFDQLQMVAGGFGQFFGGHCLCEQRLCRHRFAILLMLRCLGFHICSCVCQLTRERNLSGRNPNADDDGEELPLGARTRLLQVIHRIHSYSHLRN